MPIYKILLPPIYGGPGKLFFDDIELSEEHAKVLIDQKIIAPKVSTESLKVENSAPETSGVEETAAISEATNLSASSDDPSSADAELLEFFNSATVGDLEGLKNIGKAKAEKIKSKAPYASLADIQAVAGMSNQAWSDAIADLAL